MRCTFPLLAVLLSIFSAASYGQETSAWIDRDPQPSFPLSPPEAPHRHSSTYQEGVQRGRAALVRATGDYLIEEAQSNVIWEQVRSMRMDNFQKYAKGFYDWQKMMKDERHQARIDQIMRTEELRLVKQWQNSRKELRDALENPLSEVDVDFQTGMVYWPAVVSGPRYAKYRQELDQLVSQVLVEGSISASAHREQINKVCREFRSQLRKDLEAHVAKGVPSVQAEFEAVERLIEGLRYTPVVVAQASPEMISMN